MAFYKNEQNPVRYACAKVLKVWHSCKRAEPTIPRQCNLIIVRKSDGPVS